MNKTTLRPFLALALASLCAPAFATHPNEVCHVSIDLAAAAKSAGAESAQTVKVRFVFHNVLTDMNPPQSVLVSRPAQGPWIYKTDVYSSLYDRSLSAVKVESPVYKTEDGTPAWSVATERTSADTAEKGAPIKCEVFAD
jgi:hypothetical protein